MRMNERGDSDGSAVLYFHGTPGSAADGPPAPLAARHGIRLFTFDRPGYAGRPAMPRADLVEVAGTAVEGVAERSEGGVVVIGWSGGGPYALAAACKHPSKVLGVGLLASWAPMDPPDPGLPAGVRLFMRAGLHLPRTALRAALAAVGRTNVGQVDDIRRIARPWGFTPELVARHTPVVVWHSSADPEVPIEPWQNTSGIDLREQVASAHEPTEEIWDELLRWAASIRR